MKANLRKILTGAAALLLTAAISVGGTFAYMTKQTEKRANNFSFASDGLNAILTEPDWDGVIRYEEDDDGNIYPIYEDPDGNGDTVYGYKDTNGDGEGDEKVTKKPSNKQEWDALLPPEKLKDDRGEGTTPGRIASQNMVAGRVANKNPIITNTGYLDEWVAAKVTFVYADGSDDYYRTPGRPLSAEDFQKVRNTMRIDWTEHYATEAALTEPGDAAGRWYYVSDGALAEDAYPSELIFYYDKILETEGADSVTAPIFTRVSVKEDATEEEIQELEDMGGFAIYIEGYAVQKSAFENGYAWVKESVSTSDTNNRAVFVSGDWSDFTAYVARNGITRSGT